MQNWMVIYPKGNRSMLSIALVFYYEKSDWDLASEREFIEEENCREYMKYLAKKHNLDYVEQNNTAYLD